MRLSFLPLCHVLFLVSMLCLSVGTAVSHAATLSREGQAKMEIIVAPDASDAVRGHAAELAAMLSQITTGQFVVRTGDGQEGIAVGLVTDFPTFALQDVVNATGPASQEQYLLRSHERGLYVVGQTQLAVRNAVYDLLHRIGHRQFFPGETWEIIPHHPTLEVTVDALESPDYLFRRIWYGYGLWEYNNQPYARWNAVNRMPGGFSLNTGHAYDQIIHQHKQTFDAHPEYYALVNGQRTGSKMCIANPAVQQLVVDYAQAFFEKNPQASSVSIDPSDGGGWCECSDCARLGTASDRALILANAISQHLEQHWPGKYVAMYAYNEHSPPPTVKARERVIVNVATRFLRGGHSTTGLLDAWREQGVKQLGIREYYAVHPWDRDLPGRAKGSNTAYLAETIVDFHRRGAVFLTAESSDNWGPCGLGYYLASRLYWNVDEAKQLDTLKEDFYTRAFGSAQQPMRQFYELIDGSHRPIFSSPLIGRMYTLLSQAMAMSDDPKVQRRLEHLVLYTRYCELYERYAMAGGKARQQAFEALIRHGWRMRETMMIHSKGLYRDLAKRDKSVSIPAEARWNVPEADNPWKEDSPWTRLELLAWVKEGMANHPPLAFETVSYEGELVPAAAALRWPALPELEGSSRSRGKEVYHLWVDQPQSLTFLVTGGLIPHFRNRGPTQLRLYAQLEDPATLVDQADAPNDGQQVSVTLTARDAGLHVLTVDDNSDLSEVIFPQGVVRTMDAGVERAFGFNRRSSFYFYVPRGVKSVGGFIQSSGAEIHDPTGQVRHTQGKAGYFHIPVGSGEDGQLWTIHKLQGKLVLMTVPPLLASSPQALLLPEEVVKRDAVP